MSPDTDAFRARYRAGISRYYNAWLHGGFVLAWGIAFLAFFASRAEDVQALEWLVVPLAIVFFNWGEYAVHKNLGHQKRRIGALFYKRHTGDHHSFFVEGRMLPEGARDYRVVFFPAWLIVLFSVAMTAAWWALSLVNANVGALFAFTLLAGYLAYEIFHACEHLPPAHPLARLPGIRYMRRHHELHHRRELMQTHNFNLTLPLMDWLLGTWHREPGKDDR